MASGPFTRNSQVKDIFDDRSCIFVQNPMIFVRRVTTVAVGRLAHVLAADSSLVETNTDFLAGITGIPFIEQISDCSHTLAVAPFTVHPVIDGDKSHIIAGKIMSVCCQQSGNHAEAAQVFDQPAADKSLLYRSKPSLYAGTVKFVPV